LKRSDIRTLILRVGGTNCDRETATAFRDLGVKAEVTHNRKVIKERNLLDYNILIFPGGFAYGDYVRSGAIWAKEIEASLLDDLMRFVDDGRPVLGLCNGFQVLVELGLLPSFEGRSVFPEAALATNASNSFECRWVRLRNMSRGNCPFTRLIPRDSIVRIPVAHGEGRFIFPREREEKYLRQLHESDQLVFRYVKPDGSFAEGEYPHNPNGAFHDIAGICSPEGNVFGLMPHPERAYYGWQLPDWTRMEDPPKYGDGKAIFEAVVEYVERKF
jgi:phosphoribosylformylglycinamidine synthase